MGTQYLSQSYWNGLIKMSLTKLFVFRALYECSLHGYALSRRVAELTAGCCSPTESTLYTTLHELEAEGYVTCKKHRVGGRIRKVYTLTEKGIQAFKTGLDAWEDTARALLAASDLIASSSGSQDE